MAGKKATIGPTGQTVSANVERLREEQRLTYAEMTRQLTNLGQPIPELGLRNIEKGQRKVDVDELVALARILRVAPVTLLIPVSKTGDLTIKATGFDDVTARQFWHWLRDGGMPGERINLDDLLRARPDWVLEEGTPEADEELGQMLDFIQRMAARNRGDD
ncbi:XRE family transcriptional regulator [Corynebacterium sp. NPDC060344]|uniref:XRE family transcriptional regulator n=1 Tax=Corynebacterium sp. NPDC060344 TaxID=3347101 RepID=UPI00365F8649